MVTTAEICKRLIGKTIKEVISLDGFGFDVIFTDGSKFIFSASDGGYSGYDLIEKERE